MQPGSVRRDYCTVTEWSAFITNSQPFWMQIFGGNVKLNVRVTESRRLDGPSVAVRSVVESITAPGAQGAPQLVNATNVYVLTDVGWCLATHHVSPPEQDDAAPEDEASLPHTLH
jgi:hypothetical protein